MAERKGEANHKITNRPSCPACGSKQVIFRMKTQDAWCRLCGTVFDPKNKKVK